MSKRKIRETAAAKPEGMQFDLTPLALARWDGALSARETDNSISVLDVIGFDPWTGEGVTAKRVAATLRSIGDEDVVVNINSPGGDLFEGMAIYNMLKEHPGKVTVKILGLAASAASIIAMAGDEVQIARAGFFMIHNTWVMAVGNRNDLRDIADQLEPFDRAMADIYWARAGGEKGEIQQLMDDETWFGGSDAVDLGYADALLSSDEIGQDGNALSNPVRAADLAMARAGIPRSERRKLISKLVGKPSAADSGTPSAAKPDTPRAIKIASEPLLDISLTSTQEDL